MRLYGDEYRREHSPSVAQEAVLRHIAECRTAALGGHIDECEHGCGFTRISYNSCGDRHCPKCQSLARADWLDSRLERLLPVPYFHVVFTIPDDLNALALGNKRLVFNILFAAASDTLKTIARDSRSSGGRAKHLGAEVGFTAVLHTWGQNILFHPHLHCVVTGGGLSPDGRRWVKARERFLLSVKVLGRLFRGKFLAAMKKARAEGQLRFHGSTLGLADDVEWKHFLDGLYGKDWVVYAKPPFGGPELVFKYLGSYTHRVAISNHRIVDIHDSRVTFTLKDYKNGAARTTMTVDAVEFLRRFLLHVLPRGFTRIRHYGLLAGCNVATKLDRARVLLAQSGAPTRPAIAMADPDLPWWERLRDRTGIDLMACPGCGGRLVRARVIEPVAKGLLATGTDHTVPDTS